MRGEPRSHRLLQFARLLRVVLRHPGADAGEDVLLLQLAEVVRRVPEAVRVVDAQAGHLSLGEQPEDEFVRRAEDLGLLDADRRQVVDVEEAAVVDLLRRDAPEGRAVGLRVEQIVEQSRCRASSVALKASSAACDGITDFRAGVVERGDAPLDDFLLAVALGHLLRVGLVRGGEVAERGEDARQFEDVLVLRAQLLDQCIAADSRGCGRRSAARSGSAVSQ